MDFALPSPAGRLVGLADFVTHLVSAQMGRAQAPVRLKHCGFVRERTDYALAAVDLTDLEDRLDELELQFGDLVTDLIRAAENHPELMDEAPVDMDALYRSRLDEKSLTSVLGVTAAGVCDRGFEALKDVVRTAEASGYFSDRTSHRDRLDVAVITDLASNLQLPLGARRVLVGCFRSTIAALVIARSEERGTRLEGWLALALARTFSAGLEALRDGARQVLPYLRDPDSLPDHLEQAVVEAKNYMDFIESFYDSGAEQSNSA